MNRDSWLGRAGEAAAWSISAVAWALSFSAQMSLAGAHGFGSWETWAWPATTDLAGLTGMLIALDQARRNRSALVAWLIAIAAAAVMVAANIGAAVGDPVSMLLHAWPPSIALASWFLLVHVRRAPARIKARTVRASTVSSSAHKPSTAARMRRLIERDPNIAPSVLARRLGVSRSHAARLLREARRPRLMDGEQ